MKRLIIVALTLPICLLGYVAHAQFHPKETAIWTYGGSGGASQKLNFNTLPPVSTTFAATPAFSMYEGGTSICDTFGVLQFYTSGNNVWMKNDQVMPNGSALLGNMAESSSQGSLIVRQPGSFSRYYIFTTPDITSSYTSTGFRYHVVDMTQNGGMGAVVLKDQLLFMNCTEKVTAVLHYNQTDIWVISKEHGNNNFRVYLLTATGLNTTPLIWSIGSSHGGSPTTNTSAGRGCMKVSPNGRKLALAVTSDGPGSFFEIFDFNVKTGQISNPARQNYSNSGFAAYGVEFSGDNSKLYLNDRTGSDVVYQYNICAGTNQQIIQSRVQVGTGSSGDNGSLQLGLDGKIYIARSGSASLGVIQNPNLLGAACGFTLNGITTLANGSLSLPNFCTSYFNKVPPIKITVTGFCEGDTSVFTPTSVVCNAITEYKWDFGDSASGALNFDTNEIGRHVYQIPGQYKVKLIVVDGNASDTVYTQVTVLPKLNEVISGPDQICRRGIDTFQINKLDSLFFYNWTVNQFVTSASALNTNSVVARFNTVTDTAKLQLVISNNFGCRPDTLVKVVRVRETRLVTPEGPDTLCAVDGIEAEYMVPDAGVGTLYKWRVTGGTIVNYDSTSNKVKVKWALDGQSNNSIRLDLMSNPNWPDTCLVPSQPFNVTLFPLPMPSTIVGDSLVCEGMTVKYYATGSADPFSTYKWTTSDNGVIVSGQGKDTVTVQWGIGNRYFIYSTETSSKGCVGPEFSYSAQDTCWSLPNVVTANRDSKNDFFFIKNVERYPTHILIFNRWGQKVFEEYPYKNSFEGENLSAGIYFYTAEMEFKNGVKKRFTGALHLIK